MKPFFMTSVLKKIHVKNSIDQKSDFNLSSSPIRTRQDNKDTSYYLKSPSFKHLCYINK